MGQLTNRPSQHYVRQLKNIFTATPKTNSFELLLLKMFYSIEKIARILDGKLVGDGNVSINMHSRIDQGTKGSLSFFANKKYEEFLDLRP